MKYIILYIIGILIDMISISFGGGGSLSFNLIYSMLKFYLEDFVLFLFVLLNKQVFEQLNLTILKYMYPLHILFNSQQLKLNIYSDQRLRVDVHLKFELFYHLRNKYLQVIFKDTLVSTWCTILKFMYYTWGIQIIHQLMKICHV